MTEDRKKAVKYISDKFANLLDEGHRLGIMFHIVPPKGGGRIIYSHEMAEDHFPVIIEQDDDAQDPAFRDARLDADQRLIHDALSYALSNLDDLNEANDTYHQEADVQRLKEVYAIHID